jgi:hypothetical protein
MIPGTGEEIEKREVVKGYEYSRGQFLTFTAEELKALDVESSKVIDLEKFAPRNDIDPVYFDSSYYLHPDGPIAVETPASRRIAREVRDHIIDALRRELIGPSPGYPLVQPRSGLGGTLGHRPSDGPKFGPKPPDTGRNEARSDGSTLLSKLFENSTFRY